MDLQYLLDLEEIKQLRYSFSWALETSAPDDLADLFTDDGWIDVGPWGRMDGQDAIRRGYGKVFGGLAHHVQRVSELGLPGWLAYFSAAAEFGGGILVIAGLLTRFAALAITIDMAVAIWKIHWKNGLTGDHGYEFTLSLAAMAFALIFFGAGPVALDSMRGSSRRIGRSKKP